MSRAQVRRGKSERKSGVYEVITSAAILRLKIVDHQLLQMRLHLSIHELHMLGIRQISVHIRRRIEAHIDTEAETVVHDGPLTRYRLAHLQGPNLADIAKGL